MLLIPLSSFLHGQDINFIIELNQENKNREIYKISSKLIETCDFSEDTIETHVCTVNTYMSKTLPGHNIDRLGIIFFDAVKTSWQLLLLSI